MSSFYGNVGSGGSSIDDGSFVQITGDTMTGALGTTELTVGSRGTGSVGERSFTSGYNNIASNQNASAEGYQTVASGSCAHAEGHQTVASGDDSHAEGRGAVASGQYSHAEGNGSQATGDYSHAEGTNASTAAGIGSHAEGGATEAIGNYSHAEGNNTHATGWSSHAEGTTGTASGSCSHTEGQHTTASGTNAHAEGEDTIASGVDSHAEGDHTIAASANQHTSGKYNIRDNSNVYVEIVGNGTANNARSNARTLDWSGNAAYAGKVTVGVGPTNSMDLTTKQYVDNLISNVGGVQTVEITSTDPVIIAQANIRYTCSNTITSLSFTPPAAGITEIIFTTGQTAPTVTLPATVKMPEWYEILPNMIYEISILDGVYGMVMSWTI